MHPSFYTHITYDVVALNVITASENVQKLKELPSLTKVGSATLTSDKTLNNAKITLSNFSENPESLLISQHNLLGVSVDRIDSGGNSLGSQVFLKNPDSQGFLKIDLTGSFSKIEILLDKDAESGASYKQMGAITLIRKMFSFENLFNKCEVGFLDGQVLFKKLFGGAGKSFFGEKFSYACVYEIASETDLNNFLKIFTNEDGFIFSVFGFSTLADLGKKEMGYRSGDFFKMIVWSKLRSKLLGGLIGVGQEFSFMLSEI